jgi:hypothetical protein
VCARAWICHGFVIPFLSLQVQAYYRSCLLKPVHLQVMLLVELFIFLPICYSRSRLPRFGVVRRSDLNLYHRSDLSLLVLRDSVDRCRCELFMILRSEAWNSKLGVGVVVDSNVGIRLLNMVMKWIGSGGLWWRCGGYGSCCGGYGGC